MKRRQFLIGSALGAGTVVLDSCWNQEERLIPLLVPDEELVPGTAYWTPSVCRQCAAGCGILVKTMLGETTKTVDGSTMRLSLRQAKKIEGNPDHLVNRGKLCARGQAGLQVLYNPDRLRGPLKRTGARGVGQYEEIAWSEGIQELSGQLGRLRESGQAHSTLFLTGRLPGHVNRLVDHFMGVLGSPNHISHEFFSDAAVRRANELTMGSERFLNYDLENTRYLISFGAAFLETWQSPVQYSLGYGKMRQGQPGRRGKMVYVGPRLSLTAANADEWLPVPSGHEGTLALGFAHVIIRERLFDERFVTQSCRGFDAFERFVLENYAPDRAAQLTGVSAESIARIAREFARHQPGLALGGGSAGAGTNGVFNMAAVNALNALVGNFDQAGGVGTDSGLHFRELATSSSPPRAQTSSDVTLAALAERLRTGEPYPVEALLLTDANPLFNVPQALQLQQGLERIPFIVSFSSFLDETTAMADLILPDHTYLESWWDCVPEPGSTNRGVGLAQPVVRPLHNTKSMSDVLLEVARAMGGSMQANLPWESFEDLLREAHRALHESLSAGQDFDELWERVLEQGGWWESETSPVTSGSDRNKMFDLTPIPTLPREPQSDGDEQEYPFQLHIYESTGLSDGRGANQPWLQELPDPMTAVVWGSWVEINPRTADGLGIREGDLVSVESAHGAIEAPAVLFPGARPDTISVPAGQGHTNYGRYASSRGANPIRILAPIMDPSAGSLAWAATRVRVSKATGTGELIKAEHPRPESEVESGQMANMAELKRGPGESDG